MVDVTLIELHFDDTSLSAGDLIGGGRGGKTVDASDEPFASEQESGGKGGILAALVGLAFLVGIAYVARKKIGGGEDGGQLEIDQVTA